jgi:hypothetical protein
VARSSAGAGAPATRRRDDAAALLTRLMLTRLMIRPLRSGTPEIITLYEHFEPLRRALGGNNPR